MRRVVVFEQRVGRPRWYEAADPKEINERVELINRRPTYLLVHAERFADVPIFASAPQQTDYTAHWSRNVAPHYGAQGLRGRIHRWAKAHNDFYSALFARSALRPGAVDAGARPATARLSPPPIHAAPIVAAVVSAYQRASALRTINRPRLSR